MKSEADTVAALAAGLGRGRAAAEANAVRRAADLDHPHVLLGRSLFREAARHLAEAGREHNRLEPLAPLAVGEAQAEGAVETGDHGLAKLVAVVRAPLEACVGSATAGRDWPRWACRRRRPPMANVARDAQAHAVGRDAGDDKRAASRRLHVADAPACAGLGARKEAMPHGKLCVSAVRMGWRSSRLVAKGAGSEAGAVHTERPGALDHRQLSKAITLFLLHVGALRVALTI